MIKCNRHSSVLGMYKMYLVRLWWFTIGKQVIEVLVEVWTVVVAVYSQYRADLYWCGLSIENLKQD